MKQDKGVALSIPRERGNLEPFATIFVEVVVPFAARSRWLDSRTPAPRRALKTISRRIESQLEIRWKRQLHPAIWVHALLVCGHFFHQAASSTELADDQELQLHAIDAAFSLLQHLTLHHDLYDLYLRIS
jgi:hypothetical protein